MKTPIEARSPFRAWAASLPVAIGAPMICWALGPFLVGLFKTDANVFSLFGASIGLALLFAIYAIPIHSACYLVTGLPIFIIHYKNPKALIWKTAVAIPVGTVLGAAMFLIPLAADGSKAFEKPDSFYPVLLGAIYGFITAIAAYRQRPEIQPS